MGKKGVPVKFIHYGKDGKIEADVKLILKTKTGKPEAILYGRDLKNGLHIHEFTTKEGIGEVITDETKRGTEEEHKKLTKENFENTKR
jgi:hypothetical protein